MSLLAQVTEGAQAAGPSSAELVVFVIIGALALGSAVSMVMMRNAVHAALMLVLNFFTIAVLYAVNEAQFLATVQIIVYAGAIMVLFLFVIMLLGVDSTDDSRRRGLRGQRASAVVLGVVLFGALAIGIGGPYLATSAACPSPPPAEGEIVADEVCQGLAAVNEGGNTQALGALLFTDYVWPFEVISVLLVIAAIGAMVLGRRDEDPRDLVDVYPDDDPDPDSEPEPADEAAPAAIGHANPSPSSPAQEDS